MDMRKAGESFRGKRYKVNIIFCSSADAAFFSGDSAPELEPGEGTNVESFASG
jgi:hypothetical protein